MLAIGAQAPEFALPDETGRTVTLRGLLADGPVVLYFYPGDFTPICTREACAFRDALPQLEANGVRVVGISAQDADSHAEFKKAYQLNFMLLADTQRVAIKAYQAEGLFGLGTSRVTYRVGQDGRIEDAVTARFGVAAHLALAARTPA